MSWLSLELSTVLPLISEELHQTSVGVESRVVQSSVLVTCPSLGVNDIGVLQV